MKQRRSKRIDGKASRQKAAIDKKHATRPESTNDSVMVLPVLDDKIVLTKEYRPLVSRWLWSMSAGTMEDGESPAECARREVEEEAGYVPGKLTPLFYSYMSPGRTRQRMHFFLAEELSKSKQKLEDDERIKVRTITLEKAVRMIKKNQIPNGPVIQLILFYNEFARNKSE